MNGNICHWEVDDHVTTVAQIIDKDTPLPIIGSLYTKPEHRNNGYAYILVHEIVNQLFKGGYKKCAIISDATHNITNKLFLEIGFIEVSKYISVNINPTNK